MATARPSSVRWATGTLWAAAARRRVAPLQGASSARAVVPLEGRPVKASSRVEAAPPTHKQAVLAGRGGERQRIGWMGDCKQLTKRRALFAYT